jgi:thioesterase domain-containing protein
MVLPQIRKERRGRSIGLLSQLATVVTRPRYAFERLITIGIDNHQYIRLAWLWRALVLFRLNRAQVRFRALTMRLLRGRAQVRHTFQRYPGPVSLFYALDNKGWWQEDLPHDLGWSDYCTAVEVCRVPGDHVGMLAPEHVENLTLTIVSQCQRCLTIRAGAERQSADP